MLAWLLLGCQSSWTITDSDSDGFTWLQGDCDDLNPTVFPGAVELCDDLDNNCDGEIDVDSPQALVWYGDVDGDGFSGEDIYTVSCEVVPGYTSEPTDCDDSNSAIHPQAQEYCNDVDDNCDGVIDEDGAIGGTLYYADSDGDGYGDPVVPITQCTQSGTVLDNTDCDDSEAASYPGAPEVCDDLDNDCDDLIDGADDSLDTSTLIDWYSDEDEDGYGGEGSSQESCSQPSGYVDNDDDCDDDDATIYPGSMRLEVPGDGVDTDCDGLDACTDLSCDGRPDVVLPQWVDDDGVYETESAVYLSTDLTASLTIETVGVLAGDQHDLNNDGYRDVVLATGFDGNNCESDSRIYWGSGPYTLDGYDELPTNGSRDVQIADFDGDGWHDLVFSSATEGCDEGQTSSPAVIYWNSSSGFDEDELTKTGSRDIWEVDVADIDDDGANDLLICRHRDDDSFSTSSAILWGDGRSFDGYTELATSGCVDQLLTDLDGDGLLDVVFANYRDDDAYDAPSLVYWNDGDRFDSAEVDALQTTAAWSVQGADLDSDGDIDLVFGALADESSDAPVWELATLIFLNDGGFDASIALPTPGSPYPAVGDLDGDRKMDVVVAGYRTNDAFPSSQAIASYIYWGADSYSESSRAALQTEGAWQATVVDFDEDDYSDILLTGYYDGSTYAAGSLVYWGSESGFSESDTTELAVSGGVYAAPVIVGD